MGSQGPQGATGPMGPMGPMGPQGPGGVSGYEIVSAKTDSFGAFVGETVAITQACPAGKVPVSGGHEMLNASAYKLRVVMSAPVVSASFTGWRVEVRNVTNTTSISGAQMNIFAACATMVP